MAILYRHIRLDKNEPFYIGIGKDEVRAFSNKSRNRYWRFIVGITDYEVDILEYRVKHQYDVIMALGSINFNSQDEIQARFSHCVDLLKTGGKFFLRANPGITHKTGPYVEIFNWTFEVVSEFAETYNLHLDTYKKDANDRLYFVYTKR